MFIWLVKITGQIKTGSPEYILIGMFDILSIFLVLLFYMLMYRSGTIGLVKDPASTSDGVNRHLHSSIWPSLSLIARSALFRQR